MLVADRRPMMHISGEESNHQAVYFTRFDHMKNLFRKPPLVCLTTYASEGPTSDHSQSQIKCRNAVDPLYTLIVN